MGGLDGLGSLTFMCNICSSICTSNMRDINRESPSCFSCQSTVRNRSVVHMLSESLFGRSMPIAEFPVRDDIFGIGMSDFEPMTERLAKKMNFTNTYYHKSPRLDITDIEPAMVGKLDFIISSEVFEHVPPPVSRAFRNAHRLLKHDGFMVLTVPYVTGKHRETVEHFPRLHDFRVFALGDGRTVLVNRTTDGEIEVRGDLVFHGGSGLVLEMRVFSEDSIRDELKDAGFAEVTILAEPQFQFGIFELRTWSRPVLAYANARPNQKVTANRNGSART
jgi:SAM-dependent methyltransferase